MKVTAVLLAAGRSERMGRDKLTLKLGGKTPLQRSAEAFISAGVREGIIAYSEATREEAERICGLYGFSMTKGGESRGESVYNALKAISCDIAVIHDGARCLVSPEIILASIASAREYGSGVAAIPVRDTLWREGEFLDRSGVVAAQTPQAFDYGRIIAAYEKARAEGFEATDDCAVYRRMWGEAHFSKGDIANQKLTRSEDMRMFEAMTAELRSGYGEDIHRLVPGRRLVLGGVDVPFRMGLLGHSDADVLLHAVTDALLGAAALGDIGRMFPDSSAEFKDISSLTLLGRAWAAAEGRGYSVGNIDSVIVAQEPRLQGYTEKMRCNMASALHCEKDRISVKATTPERTGPEGALECITARCVCLLRR